MSTLSDTQAEEAERILGYHDALVDAGTFSDRAREWNHQDALRLLRDLLPDWSAHKTRCTHAPSDVCSGYDGSVGDPDVPKGCQR